MSVRSQALVGGCGPEWKQEAEQQQRRPPAERHVRLLGAPRPAEHPRVSWGAGPRTGSKPIKDCEGPGVRGNCAQQRAPCGHGCLPISIRYHHRSSASLIFSSRPRKSAQHEWTEPAHRFPPRTTARNRFFHVRTVRTTRRAPQLQPRPTVAKFAGPAGAAEPNRTHSENKEKRGSKARAGEPSSSVTGSVLKAGGVTRGRSFKPGTVTAQSDVIKSDGPEGKQRE